MFEMKYTSCSASCCTASGVSKPLTVAASTARSGRSPADRLGTAALFAASAPREQATIASGSTSAIGAFMLCEGFDWGGVYSLDTPHEFTSRQALRPPAARI